MEHLGTRTLVTNRLILREFDVNDSQQIFTNWGSDELTARYVSWKAHANEDETKAILEAWLNDYDILDTYNWAVELKDTREIIGRIMVTRKKDKFQTCRIGYNYGSKYWGNGYATEVLKEVCRYLLEEVGYRLVEARYISGNPASGRVMEKAGMKKDGILRQRQMDKITGDIYDLITYSIVKEELYF